MTKFSQKNVKGVVFLTWSELRFLCQISTAAAVDVIISDNCSKCTLYGQYSICPFSVKVWEDQMYISGRNCLPCLKKTQICYALILFLHLTLRTLNWRCAGFQVWSVWEGFLFVLQEASDFVHMHMQQMADKLNENIAVSCWYYVNLFVCLLMYLIL